MTCPCENCCPADEPVTLQERLFALDRYCHETMKSLQAANIERERLRRLLSPVPTTDPREKLC